MMHKTNPFYLSPAWYHKRREVLRADMFECQICKARGRYTKATHVHHEWHLDKYPQFALDAYVDGKRNLISVCKDCHETVCHPEKINNKNSKPLNDEKW